MLNFSLGLMWLILVIAPRDWDPDEDAHISLFTVFKGRVFPLFLRFSIGKCRNYPFVRAFQ